MILFSDLPTVLRQIMMIISFIGFVAVSASFVTFIKNRKWVYTVLCILCFMLGYSCMQVMMSVSKKIAMNFTYYGFGKYVSEMPAFIVVSGVTVFIVLCIAFTFIASRILKKDLAFPHFSKLKVQIHDIFGLSIVATKAYYDGQNINRDTVKMLFSKCGECFTDKDLLMCRTYDNIYEIGKLIGVKPVINGTLPADENIKHIICAAISECMINTFSHAWGDAVYVEITDADKISFVITNNGRLPKTEITERGGLKHLRELIEGKGGSMFVSGKPQFTLKVSVPKEGAK